MDIYNVLVYGCVIKFIYKLLYIDVNHKKGLWIYVNHRNGSNVLMIKAFFKSAKS